MKFHAVTFARLGILGIAAALASSVYAQDRSQADAQTLAKVHVINQAEIKIGQLAEAAGTTPAARSYGKTLVRDHSANDLSLMSLARLEKFDMQAAASAADVDHLKLSLDGVYAKLKATGKATFDRAFAKAMVDGHTDAIAMVRTAEASTKDASLKQFLGDLRPKLESHRDMAEAIQSELSAH